MTDLARGTMSVEPHVRYFGAKPGAKPRHNHDVDWKTFESEAYWDHNYRHLRKDDQKIINTVAAHFSDHFAARRRDVGAMRGVDVGSGANLYPALSMLPWCSKITLTDLAITNCTWLEAAIHSVHLKDGRDEWTWQPFWDEFRDYPGYELVTDPQAALADRARLEVLQASVMDLPERNWDIGTMFFVADSMTSYPNEFEDATACFMRSLLPGSPFAAAFMDSSLGYVVADQTFPAVREVNSARVKKVLAHFSGDAQVNKIGVPPMDALREGYDGMIVAVGTRTS
jgi:hypothetical protein